MTSSIILDISFNADISCDKEYLKLSNLKEPEVLSSKVRNEIEKKVEKKLKRSNQFGKYKSLYKFTLDSGIFKFSDIFSSSSDFYFWPLDGARD